MGKLQKVKDAIGGMTQTQKIMTFVVAVLIPIGAWLGIAVTTNSWTALETPAALAGLGIAELADIVASIKLIFGVSPPVPEPTPAPAP